MAKSRLEEIRDIRLEKVKKLREMGIDPYPAKSKKEISNKEILENFEKYEGKEVTTAGRLMSWREHGNIAFGHVQDESGKIQIFVQKKELADTSKESKTIGFKDLKLLDIGDFVQVTGKVGKTVRGEVSIVPNQIRLLTKSLRPLPEKHEGLKDIETRLRRRYVDTTINREVFDRFLRRSKFWQAHRDFFREKEFVEINIPVLEHIPGGGDATPFITHMDAIDEDFYLRISQELYLKRLVGGGYEKVYEIGPRFRNEGLSDEHLPEHIAMEFYWAYADWKDGMEFIKKLFNFVINEVYGDKKVFNIRGFEVDFNKDWETIDFGQIFKNKFNIDVYEPNLEDLKKIIKEESIEFEGAMNTPRLVDAIWKHMRKEIAGPAFLINHPKYLSPLQKPSDKDPRIVERFQPIIAGSEMGNGWSEVNDAIDQFERFSEQQKLRDAGDTEAQWLDIDYVEMLEYGMPPTFGYGHSERVFWYLEDVPAREGVPFPQLKYNTTNITKRIYNIKNDKKR
jgi:lysyl-tRNA synthetase, class II